MQSPVFYTHTTDHKNNGPIYYMQIKKCSMRSGGATLRLHTYLQVASGISSTYILIVYHNQTVTHENNSLSLVLRQTDAFASNFYLFHHIRVFSEHQGYYHCVTPPSRPMSQMFFDRKLPADAHLRQPGGVGVQWDDNIISYSPTTPCALNRISEGH